MTRTGNLLLLAVLGWVQIFPLVVSWVGLGQSADVLGWLGSHKMDPYRILCALTMTPFCLVLCICPVSQDVISVAY